MESEKIRIMVSARHLHLTQATVDILFGKGHVIEPDGPAHGQFLSTTRATVVGPKGRFERVAIMGPCRDFDQFEISMTDSRALGVPGVLRMSGDTEGTPGIKIIGTVGEVTLDKGVIVAKRHIHLSPSLAAALGIDDGDSVMMRVEGEGRSLIFDDTIARINGPEGFGGLSHIDTDEGNAAGVGREAFGYIVCKSGEFPKN